jgi:hypothetical protein
VGVDVAPTPAQLARQGHDESPAGTRASLDLMKEALIHPVSECSDLCIHGARPAPPHPVHGRPAYGGFDNLECAGELTAVYDKWAKRAAETGTRPAQSNAHEHAMRMVLMKISRIATGSFDVDHYDDAKVYVELAKQVRQTKEKR